MQTGKLIYFFLSKIWRLNLGNCLHSLYLFLVDGQSQMSNNSYCLGIVGFRIVGVHTSDSLKANVKTSLAQKNLGYPF